MVQIFQNFERAYFTLKKKEHKFMYLKENNITKQLMFSFRCLFCCIILYREMYLIEELTDVKQRWYLPWPYGIYNDEKTSNHSSLNVTLLTINNVKKEMQCSRESLVINLCYNIFLVLSLIKLLSKTDIPIDIISS